MHKYLKFELLYQ